MAKPYLRNNMYYSNFRANGKRVRKALSPNKRTAQAMLDDMVSAIRSSKNGIIPQNIRWESFKERYLEWSETEKKKNTAYRDKYALNLVDKTLPIQFLGQMTPEFLERLKFKWREEERTPSTITRNVKAIKRAMHKAEEWGYMARQDWRLVKVKEPKGRLLYYSVDELESLLSSATGIYKTSAMIMARAGLRSGEVYHLEWEDIDFNLHKIRIDRKPCHRKCPGCESGEWDPKGKSRRWVPIHEELEKYLARISQPSGYVLGKTRPLMQPYQKHFKREIKNAGLMGSPHTLRHTFGAHLASAGVPLRIIQAYMGHASIRTTEMYSHLIPEMATEAIGRLPVVQLGYIPASKTRREAHEQESIYRRRIDKTGRPEDN